jgi:hypothetical protein
MTENDLSKNPLNFPFTGKEGKLGISKLKNNTSTGPELTCILNEVIKTCSNILLKTLVKRSDKVLSVGPLDFSEAFDSVWRTAFLFKLARKRVSGNFHELINHMYMYSSTMCAMKENTQCSQIKGTTSVPLYSIYL